MVIREHGEADCRSGSPLRYRLDAAARFAGQGRIVALEEYGHGNVHDTFLVTLEAGEEPLVILQRLNTFVFRQPERVMGNMRLVTEYILARLSSLSLQDGRRWEVPRVLLTRDAEELWRDPGGSFWRALSFIPQAQPFDTVQDTRHAREVGHALGLFHSLISDLPVPRLADTLEGFHHTPRYLGHYDEVLARKRLPPSPEMAFAQAFVDDRRAFATVLEEARERGRLFLRPIHGDPKVNNILIDTLSGQAVCMIDLDTVKPGLVQYDIGDCLRSCCNPLGEETAYWEAVRFEPDLCQAILQGYLAWANTFLTENDHAYLFDAIRLITFELGLRFLTDYLEGNVYFKAGYGEHNLVRALVQFNLTKSIESEEQTIRAILRERR